MEGSFSPFGTDLFGEPIRQQFEGALAQKFIFPPFTLLDARSGDWQDRKRAWIALGLKSEIGRESGLLSSAGAQGRERAERLAEAYGLDVDSLETGSGVYGSSTSVFDPVLCELLYTWFSPPGGIIIDPFAGGSVRGVIATLLGREYHGCELRQEQVDANREQWEELKCHMPGRGLTPTWYCDDSRIGLRDFPRADFLLSCPPYGNLEQYSEDSRDLSTLSYRNFLEPYSDIIGEAASRLHNNRFAAWVVSNFRDSEGLYHDLVSDTTRAFDRHGLQLYNDAVLVTPVGSARLRCASHFEAARKMPRVHQNVLIYVKGDAVKATTFLKGHNKQPKPQHSDLSGTETA